MKKSRKLCMILTMAMFLTTLVNLMPVNVMAAEVLTPYNCFSKLTFEGNAPDHSTWGGTIDLQFVKNDATLKAHSGEGAMYVNSTNGQFSVWGGPDSTGANMPKAGDKVGGYFYYKRLRAGGDWKLPRVRVYPPGSNNESTWLAVTKDINTTNNNIAPIGEWIRIELESTGKTIPEGLTSLNYNITTDAAGNEFMIDDVVFGSLTEQTPDPDPDPEPIPPVSKGIVPVISEYAGSTMNGDFEVGNDSVGNQYWGSHPDASIITLITNPAATEAKTVQSGKNMIQINASGTSWNLFNFATQSDDSLPRQDDVVGGSYWLYVPKNADLTKNVPYVNFGYQGTGADVMISTGSGFDKSKLVKGTWNEIPILPMANGSIQDASKMAAIFMLAQNIDTSVKYYIDNIKVGKIKNGLFFSSATTLTDENGNMKALAAGDTEAHAKIVIQNSLYTEDKPATVVVSAYEGNDLKAVISEDITIAAKGSSGVSVTSKQINHLNIAGVDQDSLRIKAYVFDKLENMTPLTVPHSLYYKSKRIAPNHENIQYIGRWAGDSQQYTSTFIRPYLKTAFTGSSIKIDLADTTSLVVTLDGVTTTYNSANGMVTLGENLSSGTHSLRVATLHYTESMKYKGLYVDSDAQLVMPTLSDKHIEFIGDSITAWDGGYSWQVGEKLGVEHTRIAWPGIALVDNFGYTNFNPKLGIASAYFKLGLPGAQGVGANVADWNFETADYQPDIIVINIGTNDCADIFYLQTLVDNFTNTYSTFIDRLRAKYPNADIFALRAVSMPAANVNIAVENMLTPKMAADSKLHYIDTTNWGVTILNDNIHPDTNGHKIITNKLIEVLTPYLDGTEIPVDPDPEPVETLVPYGCWGNLTFENGGQKPGNFDQWTNSSSPTEITFTNSSDLAHSGNGAVKIEGGGFVNFWGVRVTGEPIPVTEDKVGGYFWVKLLATPSKLPNVKMVQYNDHNVAYCRTKPMTTAELNALPLNTWIKIELESTGMTYTKQPTQDETSGFLVNIEPGFNGYIDDITFGKLVK